MFCIHYSKTRMKGGIYMEQNKKRQRQTKTTRAEQRQGTPVDKKLDGPNRPST